MRVLAGIIWFLFIYFGILYGAPNAAAEIANFREQNSFIAYRSTRRTVREYHAYIMAGVGVLTIAGCGAGVLPGSRRD